MNRNVALVTALAAGMLSAAGAAQTTGSTTPAPATAPAPVPVQVVQAKIAVIEYEQVTAATNEGQRALQTLQKKYEPQKNQLQALQTEIDSLTKQVQSAPATMSEDERASRARTIDTKQKQLQRDGEDATNAFNAELQDTLGAVAKKMGPIVIKYVQANGYTLLLDNTGQQGGLAGPLDSARHHRHLAGHRGCLQRLLGNCGTRSAFRTRGESSSSPSHHAEAGDDASPVNTVRIGYFYLPQSGSQSRSLNATESILKRRIFNLNDFSKE